jgi:hypothetical protein
VILEVIAGGEADSVSTCRTKSRLLAVIADFHCGTTNLDGIGLIAPVEDPVWSNTRGLGGFPEGTLSYEACEAVARSLEMNVDSAAC